MKSDVVVLCFEDEQDEGYTREADGWVHEGGELRKRLRYQQSMFDTRVIIKK